MGRIIGLDVGERRIGVAVSDPSGTLARPVTTLRTSGLDGNALQVSLDEITRLAADDPLEGIVIGLPRRLDGAPNALTEEVRALHTILVNEVTIPVILQDERLSSYEAERALAERIKDWRKRKGLLDAAAAAVILQDYLDGLSRDISTHRADDDEQAEDV